MVEIDPQRFPIKSARQRFSETELTRKLKRVMLFRMIFSSVLLGSAILIQWSQVSAGVSRPLLRLYILIGAIFLVSLVYSFQIQRVKDKAIFALAQVVIDTVIVTLIISLTGGFTSVFSFLYLLVVVYASLLLPARGVFFAAAISGFQFALLTLSEYYQIIGLYRPPGTPLLTDYHWLHILTKVGLVGAACFIVAYLSHLLADQNRHAKQELENLENRIKRVEKMASLGEMAAGLAHEIKNPLASIAGSIQMLKEDLSGPSHQSKLMEIVLRETDRLSTLVTSFLMFARPPQGSPRVFDLAKLLGDTFALFKKDMHRRKHIEFQLELQEGLWVRLDPEQIKQVVWNLLLNAAEAIESKGKIALRMEGNRQNQAVISIQDTGSGMSSETLEAVFNPFFSTKSNGTGLGLSIVHSIVDSHNGWLDVKSQVGVGTQFTLRFDQVPPP